MVYDERCDRYFSSDHSFSQHQRDHWAHWVCWYCGRDCASEEGLQKHQQMASTHGWCSRCQKLIGDGDALNDHCDREHWWCKTCRIIFSSEPQLLSHYASSHHYCAPCKRLFMNQNNLKVHTETQHSPKNVKCPGRSCGRAFLNFAELVAHFESGTCPSGVTRQEVNRQAIKLDKSNIITNLARLIGYDPDSSTTVWATERSWNGYAYECILCHRTFRSLVALNSHLKSAIHYAKIYRCPNRDGCGKDFQVLSALLRHVEKGSCGVRQFRVVKDAMDQLSGGMRRLTAS